MTVVKYNKKGGFPSLFDSFFENDFGFFPEFIKNSHMNKGFPAVNTRETDKSFLLEVAAPGLEKSDFTLNLEDNVLTISSETKTSKKEDADGYISKEFGYSSFSRSFTVPDNVSGDDINAKYENGILKIELPKIKDAKKTPKTIEIY